MSGAAFGVPPLDRHLGQIPKGGTLLVRGDPTIDSSAFLLQSAAHHLNAGSSVIVLLNGRSPASFAKGLAELGIAKAQENLFIIDAYSALMGSRDSAAYHVDHPDDLMQVQAIIEQAGREHPKSVLLYDSLNGFLDRAGAESFLSALPRFLSEAPQFVMTAALFTAWGYPKDVEDALATFDATIQLRAVEDRVVLHQTMAVERTPWGTPAKPVLFTVQRPGGILAYIPKIVVIGPHNAGKTTFVHSVSNTAVSVERMGTTVALDHGSVVEDGVRTEVFGTPGQERFDPLLQMLAGQAVGAILLVDATEPDSFKRGKLMLDKIWKRGLRVIIALNKSDDKKALGVAEATLLLSPPEDVQVMPCTGKDAKSARAVLKTLVDKILAGGPA